MQILATRALIVAASLFMAAASPAYSQGPAPRTPATGGLFGATRSDVGKRDKLNFTFQLAEGWDSELPPDVNSRLSRGLDSGGFSTVLQASSDYSHNRKRVQLTGDASTAFKYYQSLDRVEAVSHSAALGASVKLPKGSWRLEQSASYSPSYLYQLFPATSSEPELGESVPATPEYRIEDTESYSYNTTTALTFGSERGALVKATGGFNRTDYSEQTASRLDLEAYEGGIEVARRFSSRWRFNIGYEHRAGQFAFRGYTTEHSAKLGFEVSQVLSRTRKAILRVNVLPTRVQLPDSALEGLAGALPEDAALAPGDVRSTRVSGEATVDIPFRLKWQTTASYRRSVEYLSVINQPVYADGARLEMKGLLTRRADLTISGGYVTAASAFYRTAQPLQTYTGQVAVRFALKRSLALSSEYLYYYYDLRGQAALSPGLPSVFEQHGVRLGAVVFLEALGR